jgi:hypothetical protein
MKEGKQRRRQRRKKEISEQRTEGMEEETRKNKKEERQRMISLAVKESKTRKHINSFSTFIRGKEVRW